MTLPRGHKKRGRLRMYLYRGAKGSNTWYRISFSKPKWVPEEQVNTQDFYGRPRTYQREAYWSNRGSDHSFDPRFWERAGGPKLKKGGGPVLITIDLKAGITAKAVK